jgi:hypothetical protein
MSLADKIINKYREKNPQPLIAEEKVLLKTSDVIAKASVESLIENRFSVDMPTRKDAITEMLSLAESKSFIADKIMEMLDDVTSNCSIDKNGKITLNTARLRKEY